MTTPAITVIFILYHAPRFAAPLVDAIRRQIHPRFPNQADWVRVVFVDNGSTDDTGRVLAQALKDAGSPEHYRISTNPTNLGYAGAMNAAFRTVTTPFLLTCHCDCLFGSDDYVATVLDLLERHAEAAAVTGVPAIQPGAKIPFTEKLNLVSYLMDIFPAPGGDELVPVGFAEGRCDGFRTAALQQAGFYDAGYHTAGEDQVLSARMRANGFSIYQAPRLRYFLGVSDEQDTPLKLIRHMVLFGKTHPILLLRARGTLDGIARDASGKNRRKRMELRLNQIASVTAYGFAPAAALAGAPLWIWAAPILFAFLWKGLLFSRHLAAVRPSPLELAAIFVLQVPLDLAYALGLVKGLWHVVFAVRPVPDRSGS